MEDYSSSARELTAGGDNFPILAQYDWAETTPSIASIEVLAGALNQDPFDLDPLYGAIDPDALDDLFASSDDDFLRVTFEHCSLEITVSGAGLLKVLPQERS